MDIIATDIGELLIVGLLVATIAGVPLLILYGISKALRKSRLPDCYGGIWTHEQATRYSRMKAQYGAKLDDLPDTGEEDTQMSAW